jgi:hypothetical protein
MYLCDNVATAVVNNMNIAAEKTISLSNVVILFMLTIGLYLTIKNKPI